MLNVFTIVLDGMPHIRRHLTILSRLGHDWRWTIVEGAAMNVNCTKWCQSQEPRLSLDGTSLYLDSITDPRVTVIKRPKWDGKVEMVNAALATFSHPGILLQVDADEVWTTENIELAIRVLEGSTADCGEFKCRYFVGPDIVTIGSNSYGNNRGEWRRMWKFRPGDRFIKHEPPLLTGSTGPAPMYFKDKEYFDHFAYADEKSVAYKERYYGYRDAVLHWSSLQANTEWPCRLKDFLPWADGRASAIRIGTELKVAEKKKPLVVISYRDEDHAQMVALADLIRDLELGRASFDLAFHRRSDSVLPLLNPESYSDKFERVWNWRCARRGDGYPTGCNEMFYDLHDRMASEPMKAIYSCWLNLEPDCLPLRRGWMDSVMAEFNGIRAKGGNALGHVKDVPQAHLNGAAIYTCSHAEDVPMDTGRDGWAYDLLWAPKVLPTAYNSKYIGGQWNTKTITPQALFAYRKDRSVETLLFHGVKDLSGIRAVRQRFSLPQI